MYILWVEVVEHRGVLEYGVRNTRYTGTSCPVFHGSADGKPFIKTECSVQC